MDNFDIPIFKKSYELYKAIYSYRLTIPKQDRYAIWQRCESISLDIIEILFISSQVPKKEKNPILREADIKVNFLKVLLRLSKEIKALDTKKYITLEQMIDEIGRMLGGWIKSIQL